VQGIIEPVPDSHIEVEVWLPEAAWNGRYIGAGNGGYSGSIFARPTSTAARTAAARR
jgi:feruloyl esterase